MKFSKTKRVYVIEVPHQGPVKVYSGSKAAIVYWSMEKHDNTKRFRTFEGYFRQLTEDTRHAVYFSSKLACKRYIELCTDPVENWKLKQAFAREDRVQE